MKHVLRSTKYQLVSTADKFYKCFQQLSKLFNILPIEINEASNTLQQSSYLSTRHIINKQLIKIYQQCYLKIKHYFL